MATPMRTTRSRPPGFPVTAGDALPDGVVKRDVADPAPAKTARAPRPKRPQPTTTAPAAAPSRAAATTTKVARDPYAGAATRQFNTRLLEPLHQRYSALLRQLEDDGYKTSMTELLHAMLHAGPENADQARKLIRDWRLAREP